MTVTISDQSSASARRLENKLTVKVVVQGNRERAALEFNELLVMDFYSRKVLINRSKGR